MPSFAQVPEPSEKQVAMVTGEAPEDGGDVSSGSQSHVPSLEKERQITVDPVSLRQFGMAADDDSPLSAPSVLTEVVVQSPLLPPLRKPKFVSASQPCSAASSPVHGAATPSSTRKWEELAANHQSSSHGTPRSLARQHSSAQFRFAASGQSTVSAPTTLLRSVSYAEGRPVMPPPDERPVVGFLPGFSKKKAAAPAAAIAVSKVASERAPRRSSLSRVASLEKFECGSWSSPAVADDVDMPLELAKNSCSDDAEAPVKMAFVFDGEPRGILRKSASRQDSARSHRHVRFSTATAVSCPTSPSSACITPRLMKARAEFNAFLEAQSA